MRVAGYPKKLSAKDWRIHKLIHRLAAAGRQAEKDNFGKSALTSSYFTPDEVTELAVQTAEWITCAENDDNSQVALNARANLLLLNESTTWLFCAYF